MPLSPTEKARRYRERMRRKGLRPVQIWIPDITSPDIAREVRRQSLLVSRGAPPEEAEMLDALARDMSADAEWTE